jgi:hypothetical protein
MLCPSAYGTMMNHQCVLHAGWRIDSGGSDLVVRRQELKPQDRFHRSLYSILLITHIASYHNASLL